MRSLQTFKHEKVVWGLWAIAFTLPLHLLANSVAIGVTFILWIWEGNIRNGLKNIKNDLLSLLLITLFLCFVIASFTSASSQRFDMLTRLLSLLLLPLIFSTQKRENFPFLRIWQAFEWGVLLSITICVVYASYQTAALWDTNMTLGERLTPFFYNHFSSVLNFNPIYLSMYASLVFFGLFVIPQPRAWLTWLKGSVLVGAILLLSARNITVQLFIFLPIIIGYRAVVKKNFRTIWPGIAVLVLVVGGILASPKARERFSDGISITQDYQEQTYGSLPLRFAQWRQLIPEVLQPNVLGGTGTGRYHPLTNHQYRLVNLEYPASKHYNAHNQFLDTGIQLGMVGVFILVAIFFVSAHASWRQPNLLGMLFISSFFLSSLTESLLFNQKGVVYFALFLMLLRYYSPDSPTAQKEE